MNILIAEDDRSFRKGLTFALQDMGYSVTEAQDGKEAIELIQKKHFDLVISDLVMPNVDGIEVYKTIQQIKPSVKFLMITSFPDDEKAKMAKKLLKNNFIQKSINHETLSQKIKILLK